MKVLSKPKPKKNAQKKVLPVRHTKKNALKNVWKPLVLKQMLEHFTASRQYERIDDYISMQDTMLTNERIILFFLHTVYDDSLATIHLYARYTIMLMNYAEKDFHQVTAADIDAFIKYQQNNGAKPATVNTSLGALKSFFRHLVDAGIITLNPTAFLKKKKSGQAKTLPGHLAHSLSEQELTQLFIGMKDLNAPLRDQALFHVLFLTGIRAEEAVRLKWSHFISWQNNWYLDVFGKGSKARRVYLPKQAVEKIRQYRIDLIATYGIFESQPLFPHLYKPTHHITRHGLYVLVKKWCKKLLGRTDVSPHWFRHSCFTQLAHKGASLESIKALAGHESVETTMRYNEAAQLMNPAGILFEKSLHTSQTSREIDV